MTGIPFGRYELLEPIGAGGMAEVWRARLIGANNFSRTVVIKRILPHLSRNREFSEMFTSEALLLARLDHPNIVQVIELSSEAGELFIAMEFLDGVDLADLIRRASAAGPLPIGFACYVVREVARALAYAHALRDDSGVPLRLIHRDVSPSNVMVLFDGRVKLLDFGIAKAIDHADRETRSGVLKGKVGYLSPEAVSADETTTIDHRADIFGAGVVFHELLCGRRLFRGNSEIQTLDLIRRCDVPAPSRLRAEVSTAIDTIVARCLARAPEDRYRTADELVDALSGVLRDTGHDADAAAHFLRQRSITASAREPAVPPTLSAQQPESERAPPRRPRSRAWWVAGALGTLVIAGLTFLVGPQRSPPVAVPPPAPPAVDMRTPEALRSDPVVLSPARANGKKVTLRRGPKPRTPGRTAATVDVLSGDVFDGTDR